MKFSSLIQRMPLVSLLFCGAIQSASAAVIVQYRMGQAGAQVANSVTASNLTAGVRATTNFSYNFGSGFPNAPVLQLGSSDGTTTVNTAAAQDRGQNVFFDLTVLPGITNFALTTFSLDGAKNGSEARALGIGYQINTGTGFGPRVDFVNNIGLTTERPSIAPFSFSLAGEAPLQSLAAGNTVRFLVAQDNRFSVSLDNITVEGIPEPGTSALLLGSMAMLFLRRRRS